MAVGVGGYYTNNLTIATAAQLSEGMLVPVDTQAAGGSAPQTFAVPIGLLGSQMQVGVIGATAFAGGGQTSATQLDYGMNTVTVVATAADSVKLPYAWPGAIALVKNADASDSMTVFGRGTDTIDGVASATGNAQAAGKGKLYFATAGDGAGTAGTWVSLLGA